MIPDWILRIGFSRSDSPDWILQIGVSRLDSPDWILQIGEAKFGGAKFGEAKFGEPKFGEPKFGETTQTWWSQFGEALRGQFGEANLVAKLVRPIWISKQFSHVLYTKKS